jgi:hypothetical protein
LILLDVSPSQYRFLEGIVGTIISSGGFCVCFKSRKRPLTL